MADDGDWVRDQFRDHKNDINTLRQDMRNDISGLWLEVKKIQRLQNIMVGGGLLAGGVVTIMGQYVFHIRIV